VNGSAPWNPDGTAGPASRERIFDASLNASTTAGIFDGFNYREFRSNAVMRYEYRPGSALFIVWQQGRSDYLVRTDAGYNDGYDFRRDYGATFRSHPNNTFLVKWSYWLNP